jgi:2'-hydroxyisoflavone reductase
MSKPTTMNRRDLLKASAGVVAGLATVAAATNATAQTSDAKPADSKAEPKPQPRPKVAVAKLDDIPKAAKPLNILILGGTGFTGPHQVRYALARGHKITLFNRGRRPKEWPDAVEELTGDRDKNDYDSLKGRKWDVVIDNPTTIPSWVRDASAVLKGNVGQYIFISTISVYEGEKTTGADENAPRAKYTGKDLYAETNADVRKNMALYGPLKAASEDEVKKHFPSTATIIRPGLIVGPGDDTDRFTYWPVRIARGGTVLVPPLKDPVQFIDARDLAEWTIRVAENRSFGDFNGNGPDYEMSTGAMLYGIRAVTTKGATFVEAGADFLEKNKVAPWMELTVWVPGEGDMAGFHRRSNARAIKAGLTFRSLATTAADTLKWFEEQPAERKAKLRAGLTAEREAELLKLIKA